MRLRRVALALALALVTACAPRPSPWSPAGEEESAPAALVTPAATPRPAASLFAVAYAVPPPTPAVAMPLFRRAVDLATLYTPGDEALGSGMAIRGVRGGSTLLVDEGPVGTISVVGADGVHHTVTHGNFPVSVETPSGVLYLGDQGLIRVVGADGQLLRSFAAPRPKPGLPAVPPGFKGVLNADASIVEGFLLEENSTYVVVSGGLNSAIVDLGSGARIDVDSLAVRDSAIARGHAYLLGADPSVYPAPLELVDVDLGGIAPVLRIPLAVAGTVLASRLAATTGGVAYAYFDVAGASPDAPQASVLFRYDGTLPLQRVALPDDLGLDLTVGVDDALYLFGGPARNVVARVDEAGALTRYAVAPAGAFVEALVVR